MDRNRTPLRKLMRILLPVEAAAAVLFVMLRVTGVLSFRLAYLAMLPLAFAALDALVALACYDRAHADEPAYRSRRTAALVLLLIAVVASVPLMTDYLFAGHDIQFHLFRIEGIRDGLLDGQFPVRIHPNTLFGNGYANPEFYPEALLYFPALLRLCGFSVMGAYKAFLLCLNLLTAYIAYVACARIWCSRRVGLVGSALYTLSLYRLVNLYTRAALGEASAVAFLPLVVLGMYTILAADPERPAYRRAFLPLLLGMTGLAATHLLSCEMVLPVLLVCALVCIRRVAQGKRLLALAAAAAGTVLLSLAFIVPMLDCMGYDTYRVFSYSVTDRAHEAVNIAQLFPLFPNATGESLAGAMGAAGEMPLGAGFVFALVLLAFPVLRARCRRAGVSLAGDRARMACICYAAGAIMLLLSTNLFPWTAVYNMGGLPATLASMLQFPWRLVSVATAALVFAACECLAMLRAPVNEPYRRAALAALLVCTLLTAASYTDRLVQTGEALFIHSNADLDQLRSVGDAEYLPDGAGDVLAYRSAEPVNTGAGVTVSDFLRDGTTITLRAENTGSVGAGVDLPLICYPGYAAQDGAGHALALSKGENALLRLTLPAGFCGDVTVRFVSRPLWRIAEGTTLLAALALAVWYVRERRRYQDAPVPADGGAPDAMVNCPDRGSRS